MVKKMGGLLAGTDEAPHPEKEGDVTPLPPETFVIDNTAIGAFKTSPRYFYYRHIRCWDLEGDIRYPLVRGSGWSLAMDAIWSALCMDASGHLPSTADLDEESIAQIGWEAFKQHWIEETEEDPDDYGPEMHKQLRTNSPLIIREMLYNYAGQRADWLNEKRLLGVEIPLVIELPMVSREWGGKVLYACRLDKLVADDKDYVYWVDHKSTAAVQRGGGFKEAWLNGWNPNPQADGYTAAGKRIYGKRFAGGLIDAALCHTSEHDTFTLLPIDRELAMIQQWYEAASYWVSILLHEMERLEAFELDGGRKTSVYMKPFPCDGASCVGAWSDCAFRDICRTHANPHSLKRPPIGYEVNEWAPFKHLSLDGSDKGAVVDHRLFGGEDLARAEKFMNTGEEKVNADTGD